MRNPRWILGTLIVCAGCAAPPTARPPLALAPFLALRPAHFPGAASLLQGFAAPDDDPTMRVGDAALLGLELRRNGKSERQLILLEVAAIPQQPPSVGSAPQRLTSRFEVTATVQKPDATTSTEERSHVVHAIDVRLTRFAEDGQRLRTSVARLFEEPLATGFWPYTELAADELAGDYASALTMSLQNLAGRDAVLQDLLFRVVDEPSLWSLATHLGVAVVLRWNASGAPDEAPGVADHASVRKARCELLVNGDSASWLELLLTKPQGATRVCGGLVGAIAQHPSEPDRLAVVRLLATRRGG